MCRSNSLSKGEPVVIVGAGIFGLSTALHLARDGFTNVTIFDAKSYDQLLYDQNNGCDAASADMNKIFRASYGNKAEHQRLAYEAREVWKQWNAEFASIPEQQRPPGLETVQELYSECGYLRLPGSIYEPLSNEELAGLSNLEAQFPMNRLKNYIINDPVERERAIADGWKETIDSANWKGAGVLDVTAGFLRADKACIWLSHKTRMAGVRFVQGEACGKVVQLVQIPERGETHICAVQTADDKIHSASLVIVAGGGWTPILVPATRRLLETTAGSIITLTLPSQTERPDLWDRFSGKRWPVISKEIDEGIRVGTIYSLPQLDGIIKIGYRVTKYTNFADLPDGDHISVPVTAYTTPSQTHVPLRAIEAAKDYIRCHLPELVPFGISYTRLCWYIDSIDNNFLIDYVPGYDKTLFVASGGSGHGFKFAPILGAHVLDALYGHETDLTSLWKWRSVPSGKRNGLEEGENGPRVLSRQKISTEHDWHIDFDKSTG